MTSEKAITVRKKNGPKRFHLEQPLKHKSTDHDLRNRVLDDACNVARFPAVPVASILAEGEMACSFAVGPHPIVGLV